MAKQNPTHDQKFLFYLVFFFFFRQRKSERRDLRLLKFIFSRQKDAVLVPLLLGLVRRPLSRRRGLLKVGI